MSLAHLIDKVTQYLSWLYDRQWEPWELAAAGIVVLVLLILFAGAHYKVAAGARLSQEHSPIIGIHLAEAGRRHRRAKRSLKRRLAFVAERHADKQAEEHVKQQVGELKATNERIQREVTESRQATDHLRQQSAALMAANNRLQRELANSKQAEEHLKLQVAELAAVNEQLRDERLGWERCEKVPAEGSEEGPRSGKQEFPLAIAEFSKTALDERLRMRIQSIAPEKGKEQMEQQPT